MRRTIWYLRSRRRRITGGSSSSSALATTDARARIRATSPTVSDSGGELPGRRSRGGPGCTGDCRGGRAMGGGLDDPGGGAAARGSPSASGGRRREGIIRGHRWQRRREEGPRPEDRSVPRTGLSRASGSGRLSSPAGGRGSGALQGSDLRPHSHGNPLHGGGSAGPPDALLGVVTSASRS